MKKTGAQGLTGVEQDEELKAHVLVVVEFELTGFLDQLKQTYPNIAQTQLVQGVETEPQPILLKRIRMRCKEQRERERERERERLL